MENEDIKNPETPEEAENKEEGTAEEAVPEAVEGIVPGLIDRDLTNEVQTAFLSYAMSVIVSRAIPDVRDGFKPVQRRIIYGMDESGMQPGKPYKKSARIVGDVMGKYHPHGDSALYLTLVRLAQPFSLRYTLVDGHGNFGSIDGDEAAAMRYTEARMNRLATEMVRDIDENTVDFVDNYDGTEREPEVLPSRIPNLIINGSEGIAVGMATNMPPHNLSETIDACVAVARNPEITPLEIMQGYLPGPDFPTGGVILGRQGILDAYTTGTGSITIRSKYHIEEDEKSGKSRIVITEIPYQVNKANMVEQIAGLVRDKVIEGISDIKDVSNKEGIRIIIDVKRDAVPEVVANNLLKHTKLQISFGIINLCLVDNAPKILPITELISNYVEFQCSVLTRRTRFRLKRDSDRDHIVVGLMKAHDNIDEVIHIIRSSRTDDESAEKLSATFGFTRPQVDAILAMTLRRLQGLEQERLHNEHEGLVANIAEYNRLLSDKANITELFVKEILEIKAKYGDKRLTEISDSAADIDNEDLIPQENLIVVLTKNGYLKRMSDDTFRTQNRGGKGVKGISTAANDTVSIMVHAHTHTDILFFTSFGKVYRMRGYMIPDSSRTGKGMPAVNLLNLDKEEKIVSIVPCDEYPEGKYLFFATQNGVVKRTALSEFRSIHSNGKIALGLKEGDSLLDVKLTDGNAVVALGSDNGKVASFYETDVRPMGRTAAGVKGMTIGENDKVIGITTSLEGSKLLVLTTKGYGKISYTVDTDTEDGRHYDGYRLCKRGSKGVITVKTAEKNGKLIAMRGVEGDEDLLVITRHGIVIRTPLSQVKICGRNTLGVKIINLDKGQNVASIAIVPHADETEEELSEGEIAEEAIPEEAASVTEEVVTPDDVE